MRALLPVAIALLSSGCAMHADERGAITPVEVVRVERHGEISLAAGQNAETAGFSFDIWYGRDPSATSVPTSVSWSINFNDYCRDRPTWVQSLVIGPSGQVWRGYRVSVPAGPDRTQYWSGGGSGAERHGGPATPGLLEAVAEGGRFTVVLENSEGERLNPVVVDTLAPGGRARLFDTFFAANGSAPSAPSDGMLMVVTAPPPAIRPGSRPCP